MKTVIKISGMCYRNNPMKNPKIPENSEKIQNESVKITICVALVFGH
jgi:hypothetical protein